MKNDRWGQPGRVGTAHKNDVARQGAPREPITGINNKPTSTRDGPGGDGKLMVRITHPTYKKWEHIVCHQHKNRLNRVAKKAQIRRQIDAVRKSKTQ